MKTFINQCAPRYNISQNDIRLIINLFDIVDMHKNSNFEFRKDEKLVILNEKSSPEIIVLENVKEFISIAKQMMSKIRQVMSN
jgi:site-specific DNA-cytosine methylase